MIDACHMGLRTRVQLERGEYRWAATSGFIRRTEEFSHSPSGTSSAARASGQDCDGRPFLELPRVGALLVRRLRGATSLPDYGAGATPATPTTFLKVCSFCIRRADSSPR